MENISYISVRTLTFGDWGCYLPLSPYISDMETAREKLVANYGKWKCKLRISGKFVIKTYVFEFKKEHLN